MTRPGLIPLIVAGLLSSLASAAPVAGQASELLDRQIDSVDALLDLSARSFWGESPGEPRQRVSGTLADGQSTMVEYTLDQGASYTFLGVCAADCGDLSFELFDEGGLAVAHDALLDHLATVRVDPPSPGVYRLRISMNQCDWGDCSFGVAVYQGVEPAVVLEKTPPGGLPPAGSPIRPGPA